MVESSSSSSASGAISGAGVGSASPLSSTVLEGNGKEEMVPLVTVRRSVKNVTIARVNFLNCFIICVYPFVECFFTFRVTIELLVLKGVFLYQIFANLRYGKEPFTGSKECVTVNLSINVRTVHGTKFLT